MSQRSRVIDLRRGFLPTDPNAFPENMGMTQQEDSPEELVKILPYEGINFLPTEYGYRSYFGIDSTINVAGLASRCSELLMFQSSGYVNLLVALCEDGIWTSNPATAAEVWTQVHITTFNPAIFKIWTFAVINNTAYFYQEAGALVYKLTNAHVWSSYAPSFLNMAGQKGIFRAGGRLGFWDSDNSVSWSSALDFADFTPALTTMADNTKFRDVVGNIVTILSQGEGFVIYSTKTIVGVTLSNGISALFDAKVVANNTGIAYATHVCQGNSDATHFAYTTTGLYAIGVYNQLNKSHAFSPILTETIDFIRESVSPVRLFVSEGRFLFISLIDSSYIDGIISSSIVNVPSMSFQLLGWDGVAALPATLTSNQGVSLINQIAGNPISYGVAFAAPADNTKWDGTYHAALDAVATGVYFTTAVSTTHWGAVNNFSPLRLEANPISKLVDAGRETVESKLNLWDATLSTFITNQAAVIAAKIASAPVVTIESFPGIGTYPTIPADPADEIVEFGKLILGTGKDKLIRTNAGNLLNILTLRRYFVDAKRIDARRDIHYTGWVDGGITYATYDPVGVPAALGLSGGNLTTNTAGGTTCHAVSTIGKSAGKWYWEVLLTTVGDTINGFAVVGISNTLGNLGTGIGGTPGSYARDVTLGTPDGMGKDSFDGGRQAFGTAFSNGDILGVALNMDSKFITIYKNNVSQGIMYASLAGTMYALIGVDSVSPATQTTTNFGATPFVYSPPAGYNAGLYADASVLQGTVSTTYEASAPLTGQYGYAEIDIKALEFKRWRKNVDATWTLMETVAAGGASPPAFDSVYPTNSYNTVVFGATTLDSPFQSVTTRPYAANPPTVTNPYVLPVEAMTITFPGASFNLTVGTPAPLYPTYAGALVLDTHLKKWGKFKGNHKLIVDYNPQNSNSNGAIPYTNFGIRAGCLLTDGKVALFDNTPTDSWIRYGKIGYFRKGFTILLEVLAHFRTLSTGIITLDASLDGRNLEPGLQYYIPFTDSKNVVAYPDTSARWHTVRVSGKWDLQYLEVRGIISGRR